MKVLSIKCGLAYLVCAGIKTVENRSWTTSYRGKLLIHSSGNESDNNLRHPGTKIFSVIDDEKKMSLSEYFKKNEDGLYDVIKKDGAEKEIELLKKVMGYEDIPKLKLCTQAIIGEVDLVDIITNSDSSFAIKGQNHWIFENAILYNKPIVQVLGHLKLWEYEEALK